MEKPFRTATGIGSLPYTDEGRALDLIFNHMPTVPHWPQLPNLGRTEGFVEQFLYPLVKTGVLTQNEKGSNFFDTGNSSFTENTVQFYNLYFAAQEHNLDAEKQFTMHPRYASGYYAFINRIKRQGPGKAKFLKGQVSGPVTVGVKLTDENLQPSFYKEELRDIVVRTLEMQMIQQVKELRQFQMPVIIFIDDPGLCFFGQAPYIGLNKNDIIESLSLMVDSLHNLGSYAGVHVCSGIDWSLLTESGVDIINLDAVNYFDSLLVYTDLLQDFIKRGGIIAWGIVPTLELTFRENSSSIIKQLGECLNTLVRKGISEAMLREQLMITPSCGTGTLSPELAEKIYVLTGEVEELL